MTRKEHKLQLKPVKLLCLLPSQDQRLAPNPFEPSPMRLAVRKVALTLEHWTDRFEHWCEGGAQAEAVKPLSLTQRVQRLIGWSGTSTTSLAVREESLEPARSWDSTMGEMMFRIRDRAGHVQRALMAQARELKEWMAQQSQATQTELSNLRARVMAQETQLEHLQTQLQDLRMLVSSQQQVLVYMGKELDSTHRPEADLKSAPSRPATRAKKPLKSKRRPPAETGQAPYLNA